MQGFKNYTRLIRCAEAKSYLGLRDFIQMIYKLLPEGVCCAHTGSLHAAVIALGPQVLPRGIKRCHLHISTFAQED